MTQKSEILYKRVKYCAHCTTLHYTTLHYTALHYTALHSITLHYTTLHYTALQCTALRVRETQRTTGTYHVQIEPRSMPNVFAHLNDLCHVEPKPRHIHAATYAYTQHTHIHTAHTHTHSTHTYTQYITHERTTHLSNKPTHTDRY